MTIQAFKALQASGKVESAMREELHFFMPQFINPTHGAKIKNVFESVCKEINGSSSFTPNDALAVLPKLLNSTVVTFMNGTTHTSERALYGYFSYHRLFLWALDEYKLTGAINDRLEKFIKDPTQRLKKHTPNVGEWLALISVSGKFNWKDAASAYVGENHLRNVMWYLKEQPALSDTRQKGQSRLDDTFRLTKVSRDLLAFQVLFLEIAKPPQLNKKQIEERYDNNFGMPTPDMEKAMKEAVKKIKAVKDYKEWYAIIGLPYPDNFADVLCNVVETAANTQGYNHSGGGGGRGGGGGGRGGGGRGRGRGH